MSGKHVDSYIEMTAKNLENTNRPNSARFIPSSIEPVLFYLKFFLFAVLMVVIISVLIKYRFIVFAITFIMLLGLFLKYKFKN